MRRVVTNSCGAIPVVARNAGRADGEYDAVPYAYCRGEIAAQQPRIGIDLQCHGGFGDPQPCDRLGAGDEYRAAGDIGLDRPTGRAIDSCPVLTERDADLVGIGVRRRRTGRDPAVFGPHAGPVPYIGGHPASLCRSGLAQVARSVGSRTSVPKCSDSSEHKCIVADTPRVAG